MLNGNAVKVNDVVTVTVDSRIKARMLKEVYEAHQDAISARDILSDLLMHMQSVDFQEVLSYYISQMEDQPPAPLEELSEKLAFIGLSKMADCVDAAVSSFGGDGRFCSVCEDLLTESNTEIPGIRAKMKNAILHVWACQACGRYKDNHEALDVLRKAREGGEKKDEEAKDGAATV